MSAVNHRAVAGAALSELFSPVGLRNPYPAYETLRATTPIFVSDEVGACFVASYSGCRAVFGGSAYRVLDEAWFDQFTPTWRENPSLTCLYSGLQNRNEPEHRRLRGIVNYAFSPGSLAQQRPRIEQLADRVLDEASALAARRRGDPVDLITEIALRLPIAHLGEVLGIPEPDRVPVRLLISDFFGTTEMFKTDDDVRKANAAFERLSSWCSSLRAAKRAAPADDVLTTMTTAHDAGVLSPAEFLATLTFMFGGTGPSAAVVGTATVALLDDPGQAELLRADPELGPAAATEALRWDAPAQIVPRVTTDEVELDGVRIGPGRLVTALVASAHRDEDQFPDAARYDLARSGTRLLTFGGGVHYCLGAGFAQTYGGVLLPRLFARFPGLRMVTRPEYRPSLMLRTYDHMPVRLN